MYESQDSFLSDDVKIIGKYGSNLRLVSFKDDDGRYLTNGCLADLVAGPESKLCRLELCGGARWEMREADGDNQVQLLSRSSGVFSRRRRT